MVDAMLPAHPRWEEFLDRLEGPEGCDFKDTDGEITWQCEGGYHKEHAYAILWRMLDGDEQAINRSLAYYEKHGGHCDCEILFNVGDE